MDSCVCAAIAKRDSREVAAVHISYGQRTESRELKSFNDVCNKLEIQKRLTIDTSALALIGGSALTDQNIDVPEVLGAEIPVTYVPFRNAHFLAVAVSWAEVLGADKIYIGAVEQDSSGYPDCRPKYYRAFNEVIKAGTKEGNIRIVTPLIDARKSEIIRMGRDLGAPLELTWSCYQNSREACGVCDSCVLRLKAFDDARMTDPIPYRRRDV
jgi:7-cyano-7-deazaguanine synthase